MMEREFDVIIVANGLSVRTGFDKLSADIGERTVLYSAVAAFRIPSVQNIIVVTDRKDIVPDFENILITEGGVTRTQSVRCGLRLVTAPYVLIHDGARPFPSPTLIKRVMDAVKLNGSGVPSLPLSDSIKRIDMGKITESPDRTEFVTVQTPQGFVSAAIKDAYRLLPLEDSPTDDSEVYLRGVLPPTLVAGERENIKITYPEDVFGLRTLAGCGYDVHEREIGKPLVLGGVSIPAPFGLRAHSDGDVVIHAVTDALLSLSGERDIGVQFPDDQPAYKGIDSRLLLKKAADILMQKRIVLNCVSVAIMAESPKLSDYLPKMSVEMAEILNVPSERIRISATTTEGLGIVGAGGIAALALSSGYKTY